MAVTRAKVPHFMPTDVVLMDPDDSARALCAQTDPEVFFDPDGHGTTAIKHERIRLAKRICAACPVIEACARVAAANGERHGVWAGLTPEERGVYTKALRTEKWRQGVAA